MKQSIVVSQGKSFTVELQSMYGSTAYSWCLSTLPKGVILIGTELNKVPSPYPIGPLIQKFYFATISDNMAVTLEFVLTTAFSPMDIKDIYTVDVQVVPEPPKQFVPYSENSVTNLKYGYPCGYNDGAAQVNKPFLKNDVDAMNAAMPYGMVYVNDINDCTHKYGFPNC